MGWLIPQGISDFRELIEYRSSNGEGLLFVDKTLLLQDLLDSGDKVQVITRPRRFGKTLNLSMLQYFLSAEVEGKPTKHLFDGLKISNNKKFCEVYQGKSPVLLLTFKGVRENTFADMIKALAEQIRKACKSHQYLLNSNKLSDYAKNLLQSFYNKTATINELKNSISNLTEFLYDEFGVKPYLLIDEYDTPIHAAYISGHYEDTIVGILCYTIHDQSWHA